MSSDVDVAKTRLKEYQGISEEIITSANDLQLRKLAARYQDGLLLPMRAMGGKTPPISEHPSRPSAEINGKSVEYLIDAASREQNPIMMKELTLRRDNFRCVITRIADSLACLQKRTVAPPSTTLFTALAHIIPFPLAPRTNQPAEVKKSTAIYEILSRFRGFEDFPMLPNDNINRLENSLTLTQDTRTWFGRLDIWLEAVEGAEDTYRLGRAHPYASQINAGTVIKLSTTDPRLALPDPRLLALHAACAKVLHACGVADVVDKIIGDMEDMNVLSTEGTEESIDLLRALLVYWELRE
ncbi:hypothetical protein BD410DRAFT_901155 [Rickenella mellea]|uniref:Uncharacterized protein n=1 Tax=Rickenella mellea TaxID=50990 RepID=A0A4Y7PSB0_9AGAM|nr:hypothetical protein BD410DRAFT_901155 [Rickenella mellea]